ncbi:MAG: hypothetical protein LQ342_001668 [Letrouitia transgressa]|nr:MAG: hypothetical protein LQ342_001668 [Letrouitia transgressa]
MASLLTIRNLTAEPIELKRCDYYEAISSLSKRVNAASPVTAVALKPPTSPVHHDISIWIGPLRSCKTNVKLHSSNKTLRLTLEVNGERYRLDIPIPKSTTLTPLHHNPRSSYAAVHLLEHSHLTIFPIVKLASWMQLLKDDTPLSAVSIPGTHNSPACYHALPSVRCQAVSPSDQLENGVRFFDIRVQPEKPSSSINDRLVLVHGVFPISLTGNKYFRNLVQEVFAFLDRNPSETVIMSVKREGMGNSSDAQLSRILFDHYAGDLSRWFTAPRIPYLGEARGKIVLIRRFVLEESLKEEFGGAGWGIDGENWADNTPYATCTSGDICVQDFYEVLDTATIEKKIKYSEEQLTRAAKCVCAFSDQHIFVGSALSKRPFYINFLTASNFWKIGCWPERIAAKINPAILDFLCRKHNETGNADDEHEPAIGDISTGIVVCDWVGYKDNWDLVRCIVGINMVQQHNTSRNA